jgi:hypothetical protein
MTDLLHTGDNQTTSITSNLADAFKRFRDPVNPQILWADALCINQNDINERVAQVQLMGLIYFKARQVRIWLGQDQEAVYRADHAASLIRRFAHPFRDISESDARELSEKLFRQHKEADNVNWRALHHLLNRGWFKRVWVVQELGLSRSATFYCGATHFTRDELYDFVFLLQHSKPGLLISYDIDLRMLRLGQQYSKATWGSRHARLGLGSEEAATFLELLEKTRGLKCKDDRDMIYAFLGHPLAFKKGNLDRPYAHSYYEKWPTIVQPDYNDSVSFYRACTELAISAIRDSRIGLQVLGHVAHENETIDPEAPSWVPLWNVLKQASHFHGYNAHYAASGCLHATPVSVYTPSSDPCKSRLSIRALRFATIRNITKEPGTLSVQTLVETLFPERAAGSNYLTMHALDWPEAQSRSRSSVNDWPAFAMTLTAGLITTHAKLVPVPAGEHTDLHILGLESYLRRYERGPPRIQSQDEDEIAEYFQLDLFRAAQSRAFFVTANCRFGLAPMCAKEGDQIWLPRGAKMPFVFRPLSESVFQLLGQAYLHGAMHGEAVEGRTERAFQTVFVC